MCNRLIRRQLNIASNGNRPGAIHCQLFFELLARNYNKEQLWPPQDWMKLQSHEEANINPSKSRLPRQQKILWPSTSKQYSGPSMGRRN